jgi:hypothetical protein
MEMYYKAVYLYKNAYGLLNEKTKSKIQKEFMNRRNKAVELLNPMYEKWNSEFNQKYPGLDGESDEYAEFICQKQDSVLKTVNAMDIDNNLVDLATLSQPYPGDIYGIYRPNRKITFELEMVPVTI